MTNYIAFVPKRRRHKPVIQFMSEGQEKAFWPYYDMVMDEFRAAIIVGDVRIVAFSAETPQEAMTRVATDFKLRLRPIEMDAIYLADDVYEQIAEMVDAENYYEDLDDADPDSDDDDDASNPESDNSLSTEFPYTNEEIFGAK